MEDYPCWYAHKELFVCNESMIERVVGSTFYTSSVYKVANDNNNLYRNIVMDTTRMNQGCHNLILDNIKFKKIK